MAANILSMCYEKGGWGDEGNSLFLKSWLRNSKKEQTGNGEEGGLEKDRASSQISLSSAGQTLFQTHLKPRFSFNMQQKAPKGSYTFVPAIQSPTNKS